MVWRLAWSAYLSPNEVSSKCQCLVFYICFPCQPSTCSGRSIMSKLTNRQLVTSHRKFSRSCWSARRLPADGPPWRSINRRRVIITWQIASIKLCLLWILTLTLNLYDNKCIFHQYWLVRHERAASALFQQMIRSHLQTKWLGRGVETPEML